VIYRVFMTDEDYIVIDADSPEEAMLKLRDAGLEPVKAEPFLMQSNGYNPRTVSAVQTAKRQWPRPTPAFNRSEAARRRTAEAAA